MMWRCNFVASVEEHTEQIDDRLSASLNYSSYVVYGLCALFLYPPQLYFYFQNADIHHSHQVIRLYSPRQSFQIPHPDAEL